MDPSQQMSSGMLQNILKQEGSAEQDSGTFDGASVMAAALLTGILTAGLFKVAAGKSGNMGILGSETNIGACFALGSVIGGVLPDMSALGLPKPILELMKFFNPRTNDDIGRPLIDLPFAAPQTGEGSASGNTGSNNSYGISGPPQTYAGGDVSMALLGSLTPDPVGRGGGMSVGIGV